MAFLLHLRRIRTLTIPSPLHHRLLSTFNSGVGGDVDSDDNPKLKQASYDEQLETKLEQLRASLLSLSHRYHTDGQLLSELKNSTNSLPNEMLKNLFELSPLASVHNGRQSLAPPQTFEIWRKKLKTFTTRLMRLREITVEGAELSHVLTHSRVDSLKEIIETFSETVTDWSSSDEEFEKIWNDLVEEMLRDELKEMSWLEIEGGEDDEPPPPLPETPEILGRKLKGLITRLRWLTAVSGEPLGYCRDDFMEDFPEIRKHISSLEEIRHELDERLEMELKGAKLLAVETNDKLAVLSLLINKFSGPP